MRSQWLRILMIGVFSLWFGVIVPGHERGAIRVPVGEQSSRSDGTCGTDKTPTSCDHCPITSSQSSKTPAGDPSQHCAICKHIGLLDMPVMMQLDAPAFYLLAVLEPASVRSLCSVSIISKQRGRAPPVSFI